MSDLDKLVPQAVEISLAGDVVAIKPLKIGQMPAFLRAITPVMQQLGGKDDMEKALLPLLKKGETVLEALQRLGAKAKKNGSQKKRYV